LAGELDGGDDMQDHRDEQSYSCDPDQRTVSGLMEKLGVVIESFTTSEDQKVSGQVSSEEKHHHHSCDGYDYFFSD
jgi:hypothetical protein